MRRRTQVLGKGGEGGDGGEMGDKKRKVSKVLISLSCLVSFFKLERCAYLLEKNIEEENRKKKKCF